ncbi:BTB incomplete domain containing protein [Pandoravirus neocaledonia]|uniref:BTB incomplete domain containing protein n=1 Tax=Pandoravirus neocaledonia TaxID=2107708 RepID=A0A2U7UD60_9VIRU|nr:BTB incomplete domain containing protein [Pandoravirus neocaledonia]AVK76295.1 BTB incomplete domain containing protein [Pandoravirus neocaledonia]
MDVDERATPPSATHLRLNVGGVTRRVEKTLAGLAPPGSRARALLTAPQSDGEVCFVDECAAHFDRMVDCLRHGTGALDCMRPYDAAVAMSLLADREGPSSSLSCDGLVVWIDGSAVTHAPTQTCDPGDAVQQRDGIVRLAVGGSAEPMDVSKSTLRSRATMKSDSRHESLLALMASNDARWHTPTLDGRLCIDQNPRHFAIVLDCQRHGVDLVAHLRSPYDLWGVRAIAD